VYIILLYHYNNIIYHYFLLYNLFKNVCITKIIPFNPTVMGPVVREKKVLSLCCGNGFFFNLVEMSLPKKFVDRVKRRKLFFFLLLMYSMQIADSVKIIHSYEKRIYKNYCRIRGFSPTYKTLKNKILERRLTRTFQIHNKCTPLLAYASNTEYM